jgi:hypothetical protein
MPIRHTVENEVTVVQILRATRIADATDATSDDFDVRTFDPGSRFLLILEAFETDAANAGVTWIVQESETDGGSYDPSTTSGSLAATGATPGNVQRVVSLLPNPAKPFVQAVADAAAGTDVDVTATLVVLPRGLV